MRYSTILSSAHIRLIFSGCFVSPQFLPWRVYVYKAHYYWLPHLLWHQTAASARASRSQRVQSRADQLSTSSILLRKAQWAAAVVMWKSGFFIIYKIYLSFYTCGAVYALSYWYQMLIATRACVFIYFVTSSWRCARLEQKYILRVSCGTGFTGHLSHCSAKHFDVGIFFKQNKSSPWLCAPRRGRERAHYTTTRAQIEATCVWDARVINREPLMAQRQFYRTTAISHVN